MAQLAQREQRLREEQSALTPPDSNELERLRGELSTLEGRHRDKRAALDAEETAIPGLEHSLREQSAAVDAAAQQVTALAARIDALTQLQDRIARSETMQGWLATHDLNFARRLWQDIEIEAGWEDALEAVLRERLNAIGLDDLAQAAPWLGDLPPGKMTVYNAAGDSPVMPAPFGLEALAAYVRCKNSAAAGALADWLDQVYVVKDRHEGLALRERLPAGALLVSGDGHVFTRHSVSFHAPDSELHGVLSRQREIEQLTGQHATEDARLAALRTELSEAESAFDQRKTTVNELRLAAEEMQQSLHESELAILRLSEQAQRVTQRGEQIAAELAEIGAQSGHERAQHDAAQLNVEKFDQLRMEFQARQAGILKSYEAAEAALEQQRQLVQQAGREAQESAFHVKTCANKIIEVENASKLIADSVATINTGIAQNRHELELLDEAP
ncbi:MAG TPA: hypothetical protein VGO84_04145, partial [Burkholderiales bacterium]|nr:hypothetical protein [Burkholderiales bacterium]